MRQSCYRAAPTVSPLELQGQRLKGMMYEDVHPGLARGGGLEKEKRVAVIHAS